MTVGRVKTDILSGVLRGQDFKCKCTVALVTNLTAGHSGNGVWTSLSITSAEQPLPDGAYDLDVHGRVFHVQCEGGQWPTLQL